MDKFFQYPQTPSKSNIEPPIDGTINELPIEKLSWEDFEKLCLRIVEIEHSIDNCEVYGIKGQKQYGIDIFAKKENGKYSSYQCKRYQVINESDLEDAINTFRKGKWFSVSDRFTFCITASLNETQLQNKFNSLKDDLKKTGITLIKWDKPQICRILKEYPKIVTDFFGKEWTTRFNGSIKLSSFEQSIIIKNGDGSSNKLISVSKYLEYNQEAFLDYNDYLKQNKLKYFSRGQFLNETKQKDHDFVTEKKIIDHLISEDYIACIISGEGGIGKTRLMYEVAKRVEKKHKYQTYRIEQNIQSIEEVFSQLKPEIKYLFVFDYIEENELFDQFIEKATKKHLHVKILGNCRNTHQWNQRYFISKHYLNNENAFERAYQRKVTQKIMQPIWVNFLNEENKKFYKTKPSFAVFLRFLFDKNLSENDITNFPDFETWLIRRFRLSLKDEKIEESTKSILLLPIIEYSTDENIEVSIRSFKRKHTFITELIEDGWLQETENSIGTKRLDTVHDTIKDELFLHLLNDCKKKSVLIDKLIETIEFAQNEKLEMNWFRSLERISNSNIFTLHDNFFIEFFNETLRELDLLTENSLFHISKTNILSETQRFECIVRNPNPFYKFTSNQSFGLSLQNAMNYFYKARKNENLQTPAVLKTLSEEWLKKNDKFTEDGYLADRFISTYINLYSINDLIQPYFFQFISNKFTDFGGFSLCSWLEQGGDKTAVKNYLAEFLKQNAKDKDSQYVLSAWLTNGGEKTIVKSYLIEFLKQNAKDKDSKNVLWAWLTNGGEKTIVKSYLIEFLKQNAKDKDSQYVLSAWLTNGGEKTVVESFIKIHLELNILEKESDYIFKAWLSNNGDFVFIKDYIWIYLNKFCEDEDASFILVKCIENDNPEIWRNIVIRNLESNYINSSCDFLLKAWLKKTKDLISIKEYLLRFFQLYHLEKETGKLFNLYLECGGNFNDIKIYMLAFQKQNAKEEDTSFVIQAWLEQGGEKTSIESYLIEFLKQNAKEKKSSFVIQAWLKCSTKANLITDYIYDYLSVHADKVYASFVLQSYMQKTSFDNNKIKPYLKKWLDKYLSNKSSKYILSTWLKKTEDNRFVEIYIIKWLKIFPDDEFAAKIIEQWINNGGDYNTIIK